MKFKSKKVEIDKTPMNSCPRYGFCGVPICLLDQDLDKRVYLEGESKCSLTKSIRVKLGKSLKNKGLTVREMAAKNRWEGFSTAERVSRLDVLSKHAFKRKKSRFVSAL